MFVAATRFRLHCVTALIIATAAPGLASEPVPIAPSGEELFADYDDEAKAFENVSGATCFEDGTCLLVADEMIAVQRIELDPDGSAPTFEAGRTYGLIFEDHCEDISKEDDCEEVDLEAVARNGRDILIAGSMGNASRSGKKKKERWYLAQFTVGKKGKAEKGDVIVQSDKDVLKQLFSGHGELDPYLEEPLQCGGLNIEGMALSGGNLFFGLRSPADTETGEAFIVQSPSSVLTADKKSDVEATVLHRLSFKTDGSEPMRNVGIRALEPLDDRLLIATGDAGVAPPDDERREKMLERCEDVPDGDKFLNVAGSEPQVPAIWIWDPNSKEDPQLLTVLSGPYASEKLEGMAVLPASSGNGKVDLLLTIDGQDEVLALALLRGLSVPD
ncbi:DUF3616 domain-containing protein [Hoeflea poritis]|uniref:DUF3616 domain-containing protein n=1 Tax=Hoeflea poritis TaxID=2993659 RepID=A0ABT4VHB9_9HYPH|nr:DUF3616 domain-containing protein [Hoeflea poritis]MDA4844075.1 DUF3616 domain-containing protein [Hoeflea poritis]